MRRDENGISMTDVERQSNLGAIAECATTVASQSTPKVVSAYGSTIVLIDCSSQAIAVHP